MSQKIFTLVIPRFEDIFHSYYAQEIIKGVTIAANHLHADILVHITERDHDEWATAWSMRADVCDGILFADIDQDRAGLDKIVARRIPYIVLNNFFLEPINCIAIDNYKASRNVIDHLVKLGHRTIATIAGDLQTAAGNERLQGYHDGLRAAGLAVDKKLIRKGGFLRTPARRAAEQLLELPEPPTAIFAASDVMALEVIDVAKKRNYTVPGDLSVVGFDDNPLNSYSPVRLTTVRQPIDEMARLGLETLHRICEGKEPLPIQRKLSARFVNRDSTQAIKLKKQ